MAGILAEMKGAAVVLGIGVNVNQTAAELPQGTKLEAASLLSLDGVVRDREAVLASLLATWTASTPSGGGRPGHAAPRVGST